MAKNVIGFFRTRADGEGAYHALRGGSFTQDEVSLIVREGQDNDVPALGPRVETGSQSETETKAAIGGLAGLAVGMIAAVLPGVGPLLAIGPLAGAIGGSALGAAAGGMIGLLEDQGVSREEAEFYAEGVKKGGALISVHTTDSDRAAEARRIMEQHGAVEVDKVADESSGEGRRPSKVPTGPLGTERR
jgi:hypothetical protein